MSTSCLEPSSHRHRSAHSRHTLAENSTPMSPAPAHGSSTSGDAPVRVLEDFAGGLVQLLSDGTVTRRTDINGLPLPSFPPTLPAEWKDVVYNPDHNLKLRIYRPTAAAVLHAAVEKDARAPTNKLPVLVYFHGGGFCVGSFDLPNFHACCLRLAGELPALVVSAGYRLAPEHRLPAAHHDARAVVSWIHAQAAAAPAGSGDPWLAEWRLDFRRVFVTGDSAGANMAHHVAVALGSSSGDRRRSVHDDPAARVAGCVLLWPFFAGVERTKSEAESSPGPHLTLPVYDQFCRLSLPVGATRDHPSLNPFGPESPALDAVAFPSVLVVVGEHDLLRDRVVEYVARLRAMGKPVELVEFDGQHHGFFPVEPWGDAADELIRVVRRFVYGSESCG